MVQNGGGVLRKLAGWAVAVALVVVVVKYPSEAAGWVQTAASWLGFVIDGLVTFFRQVGN
ncbi:hypothetical protein SACE_0248 [Saccharopolyspora erythraea NRRL 2338]|uniref:Uncharacterized protein n=2 Tax=Saccharopolyspora erythraea TaxID=1836 RepID=A4F6C5_SACEN|nr:hypothetical protein JQX30_01265 [Saccharopolyspora erythraea]CAL99599.1 hypothetical protein SACE_0248 [Saccharopolyspora erythraea NRRL 2338]QRK93199.1 hypothetical protein JQX30_01425 [Saccharopolyspora erythraea]QRK93205.1 hypothetical protein JQX30_01490 [Saccharopolyspora erythraea]QRK93213.1 hypothetical protein JQX30_01585 [Saccharopolyspora erythraea]